MKITCTGCMHGEYPELPGGDLLIITGDITGSDKIPQWTDFYYWLILQPYRMKIYIAGNHDRFLKSIMTHSLNKEILEIAGEAVLSDVVYLCDDGIEFEGIKIWGSPWTYRFPGINKHCMAFTLKNEQELAKKFALIPEDTDILITHGPPVTYLDSVPRKNGGMEAYESVGSGSLLQRVRQIKPRLHVFSHVHEGYGRMTMKYPGYGDENNMEVVNCSHMNGDYDPVNPPITVEYHG